MKLARGWPATLSGRLLLILFASLLAAQLLAAALVFAERVSAMRGMMAAYLASDVSTAVAVLERLPAPERAAWLPRLAKRNYRFVIAPASQGAASESPLASALAQAVAQGLQPPREVRALRPAQHGDTARLQLQLADGTPLGIDLLQPPLEIPDWAIAAFAAQFALLALLGGLAVRQATRPLERLARAADALDPTQPAAPLPLEGPAEVTRATAAFNLLQDRVRAHLDERMRILAAVSHDLQTPITRLRLRADLLDDTVLRDKLHADLAEMQHLVEEGLSYARSAQAVREPARATDLAALLDSLALDYADAGQPVRLARCDAGTCTTRPAALRRLLGNLVDNALKFAGTAEITCERAGEGGFVVSVLDRGPGIPPGELEAVMQPFYRLETSRSRATGGTGLGLAIAQQLAQALEGSLALLPREGGGLQARLALPAACGTH